MRVYILCDVAAALVMLFLLRFVFLIAWVKGRSMMNTLHNRQILFALRYRRRGREIRRFDIVLCRYPNRKELFVKRVIGLPGEVISMTEGTVYINDAPLEETFDKRPTRASFAPREIGADEYFVMGDNRPCSSDSRNMRVGALPRRMILARVCLKERRSGAEKDRV